MNKKLSVALVYDKVNTKYGGAEVVLQALKKAYPNAPLYTSVYDRKNTAWANSFSIYCSFLQKIPFLRSKHQFLAALLPIAFEQFNFDKYDIVISITSGEAKGVLTKPNQLHICYMLTPPRYLYSHYNDYISSFKFFSLPIIKELSKVFLKYLRWWDLEAAHRPDQIIAISNLISERIWKFYHRSVAEIIYPPLPNSSTKDSVKLSIQNYLLCISRLVPYKKIDIAINACVATGRTLIIAGSGLISKDLQIMYPNLTLIRNKDQTISEAISKAQKLKKQIIFLNSVNHQEVNDLYQNAAALIMPGEEDFGISALQAASHGLPSILAKTSGVSEILGQNAITLSSINTDSLVAAINSLNHSKISSSNLKNLAEKHTFDNFTSQFEKIVYDLFIQHQKKGPNVYI
jgi:glycosyltransferase involved in cell wall biosynthesis